MTGLELAVVALVVSIASCLQGAIGFGVALLSAPVIALFDPTLLPGSLLLVVTGLTALGVLRDRAAVDVKDAGWAVAGQVPGTVRAHGDVLDRHGLAGVTLDLEGTLLPFEVGDGDLEHERVVVFVGKLIASKGVELLLGDVVDRNRKQVTEGISDQEYSATIDVLQRMARNLGWEG